MANAPNPFKNVPEPQPPALEPRKPGEPPAGAAPEYTEFGLPPGGPDTYRGRVSGFFGNPAVSSVVKTLDDFNQHPAAKFLSTPVGWLFRGLNWSAEQTEKGLGIGAQVRGALMEPEKYGTIGEVIERPGRGRLFRPGVIPAASLEYETMPANVVGLSQFFLAGIYKPLVFGANAVPVWEDPNRMEVDTDLPRIPGGLTALVEARRRIAAGEPPEVVVQQIGDRYGVPGVARDVIFQSTLDPLNVALEWAKPVQALRGMQLALRTEHAAESLTFAERLLAGVDAAADLAAAGARADDLAALGFRQRRTLTNLWGLLDLSPSSRGFELENTVSNNLLNLLDDADDPEEMVRRLERFHQGAMGPAFGHAAVSVEGRATRAAISTWDRGADLLGAWRGSAMPRALVERAAQVANVTPTELLRRLEAGQGEAIFRQFRAAATAAATSGDAGAAAVVRAMERGELTRETLEAAAKILDGVPYTPEMFKAELLSQAIDASSRVAIAQFGIKQESAFFKFANALKGAQSMVLLGINPGYLANNVLNNELTMIARGAWGLMGREAIDSFWERVGLLPPRLRQGVGMADLAQAGEEIGKLSAAAGKGSGLIQQAVRGQASFFDRVADFSRHAGAKLPVTGLAQKAEQWASARAMTAGFQQMWARAWREGVGFDPLDARLAERLAAIDPAAPDLVYGAVRSSMSPGELERAVFSRRLDIQPEAIAAAVARAQGLPAESAADVLRTSGVMDLLEKSLPQAENAGDVERIFGTVNGVIREHLDDLARAETTVRVSEAAAKAAAEGPVGIVRLIDDIHLSWLDWWTNHAREVQATWDSILREGAASKGARVRTMFASAEASYRRAAGFEVATIEGIEKGLAELRGDGFTIGPEFLDNIKGIHADNAAFHQAKQGLLRKFFDTDFKGDRAARRAAWEATQGKIDGLYSRLIEQRAARLLARDEAMLAGIPEAYKPAVREWRARMRQLIVDDMTRQQAFRQSLEGLTPAKKNAAWRRYNEGRLAFVRQYTQEEMRGTRIFVSGTAPKEGTAGEFTPAVGARVRSASGNTEGVITDILPDGANGQPRFKVKLDDGQTVIRQGHNFTAVTADAGKGFAFIPDLDRVGPRPLYMGQAQDQLYQGTVRPLLDGMQDEAARRVSEKGFALGDLPADVRASLRVYVDGAKGRMRDARLAALRWAEFKRDSALLNYSRRYGFDQLLGAVMPYEFWTTHSVYRWALHSLDNPAILATYARIRRLQQVHTGRPGFPERLRNTVRIPAPFLPDWMGDSIYVDPLELGLPFDKFLYPFEYYQQQMGRREVRAVRVVSQLAERGEIGPQEAQQALTDRAGPVWERALAAAEGEDENLQMDAFDLASLMWSPHLPLAVAYNVARGHPERIGPLLPLTRLIKSVSAAAGFGPPGGVNIEGGFRRAAGWPEWDQWQDYRIERALGSMAADGTIDADTALLAMIERKGPAWIEAQKRVGLEQALPGLTGQLGIPVRAYPAGEEAQRQLKDQFDAAYARYNAGDPEALADFFEKHPEYRARLALNDKPEERLEKYLVDELWSRYNALPELQQKAAQRDLGSLFREAFISAETRSYDALDIPTLTAWLKAMGGRAPDVEQTRGVPALPVGYVDERIAAEAQEFYDYRDANFPTWFQMQVGYYDLADKAERRAYLARHPELKAYWDWRRAWLDAHPQSAPFIRENVNTGVSGIFGLHGDGYESPRVRDVPGVSNAAMVYRPPAQAARRGPPAPVTPQERPWEFWIRAMTPPLINILREHFLLNYAISAGAMRELERVWDALGRPGGDLQAWLEMLRAAHARRLPARSPRRRGRTSYLPTFR